MTTVSKHHVCTDIHTTAVQQMLEAAVAQAHRLDVRINVAVVNRDGVLMGFLRMNDAPLHSIDIAIDKAYTAASFGLATGQWTDVLKQHSAAVGHGLLNRPRFVGFGGGLPVSLQSQTIGGIGVSGGSEQQDEEIAAFALKVLAEEI